MRATLPRTQAVDGMSTVGALFPMIVREDRLYGYRIQETPPTRACHESTRSEKAEVRRRVAPRRDRRPPSTAHPGRHDNNLAAHFIDNNLDLLPAGRRRKALPHAIAWVRLQARDPHRDKAPVLVGTQDWTLRHFRRRTTRVGTA